MLSAMAKEDTLTQGCEQHEPSKTTTCECETVSLKVDKLQTSVDNLTSLTTDLLKMVKSMESEHKQANEYLTASVSSLAMSVNEIKKDVREINSESFVDIKATQVARIVEPKKLLLTDTLGKDLKSTSEELDIHCNAKGKLADLQSDLSEIFKDKRRKYEEIIILAGANNCGSKEEEPERKEIHAY